MSVSGVSASLAGTYTGGRSTLRGTTGSAQENIAAAADRLARASAEVSSGKRILRPSDDVVGTDRALELRRALGAEDRYAMSSADAISRLGTSDTALQRGISLLRSVRDLAVQAGSDTHSASGRAAFAQQVRGLREDMLATANTTHLGRPVFGGTTAGPVAFTTAPDGTVTPAPGVGERVDRTIAPGVDIRVDTVATDAFGADAASVFAVLDRVVAAVGTGGAESSAVLADLDASLGRMTTALTDVGTRYSRVQSAQTAGSQRELSLTAAKQDVEEVDLAKALMELAAQDKAYKAALGAAAKVVTPSIMDFLR